MNKYDTYEEKNVGSEEIALQWWNFRQIKIKYNYFIYWFSRKNYRYLSDITPKCLVIY